MLVCVTTTGEDLDSKVDPRFARAAYFIIYDTDTDKYEVIGNEQTMNVPQGAGVQASSTIVDSEAKVVLTGNCGPNAFRVLQSSEIEVYVGLGDLTAREAIEKFKAGELESVTDANVEGHWT